MHAYDNQNLELRSDYPLAVRALSRAGHISPAVKRGRKLHTIRSLPGRAAHAMRCAPRKYHAKITIRLLQETCVHLACVFLAYINSP